MFPSMEVRWFYEGTIPPEVLAWFQRGNRKPKEQSCRVDYYLRLDSDSLGIKLREGRIEVKQRHHHYGVVCFHEQVTGLMDHWWKWSFKLTKVHSNLMDVALFPSSWIGVKKERRLWKYRLATETEEYPERGCHVELTNISVGEKAWWSLGFEAFGDESTIQEDLFLVIKHVLTERELPITPTDSPAIQKQESSIPFP